MAQFVTLNPNQADDLVNAIINGGSGSATEIDFEPLIDALAYKSETPAEQPFDTSNFVVYQESGGNVVTVSSNNVSIAWDGTSAIGMTIVFPTPIPSNIISLKCEIETGASSYSENSDLYSCGVGLRTLYTPNLFIPYTDGSWTFKDNVKTRNTSKSVEFDLSNVQTDLYFYIIPVGWTAAINNIVLVDSEGGETVISIGQLLHDINNSLQDIAAALNGGGQ